MNDIYFQNHRTKTNMNQSLVVLFLFVSISLGNSFHMKGDFSMNYNGSDLPYEKVEYLQSMSNFFVKSISNHYGGYLSNTKQETLSSFHFNRSDPYLIACDANSELESRLCQPSELRAFINSLTPNSNSIIFSNLNCNSLLWIDGCEPGLASAIDTTKSNLTSFDSFSETNDESPFRSSMASPCCPGFFCPRGLSCMIPCPLGSYCPSPVIQNVTCTLYGYSPKEGSGKVGCGGADTWQTSENDNNIFCPSGYYCKSPTEITQCTPSHACNRGSIQQKTCSPFLSCNGASSNTNLNALGVFVLVILLLLSFLLNRSSSKFMRLRQRIKEHAQKKAEKQARESVSVFQSMKHARRVNRTKRHKLESMDSFQELVIEKNDSAIDENESNNKDRKKEMKNMDKPNPNLIPKPNLNPYPNLNPNLNPNMNPNLIPNPNSNLKAEKFHTFPNPAYLHSPLAPNLDAASSLVSPHDSEIISTPTRVPNPPSEPAQTPTPLTPELTSSLTPSDISNFSNFPLPPTLQRILKFEKNEDGSPVLSKEDIIRIIRSRDLSAKGISNKIHRLPDLQSKSQLLKYAYARMEMEKKRDIHGVKPGSIEELFAEAVSCGISGMIQGFMKSMLEIELVDFTMKSQHSRKLLLSNICSRFIPGRLTAIMGPPDSGQSHLVHFLAGKDYGHKVMGEVYVNGKEAYLQAYRRIIGFVPAENIMHENLTVEENLWFSAMYRLPASMSLTEKVLVVERTIMALGLEAIRNQRVGSLKWKEKGRRGISAGERKRVSVGMEMVSEPSLLLLDEICPSIDSTSLRLLLRALLREASRGVTVVAVLSQPSNSVFCLFDDVILLTKDCQVAYSGAVDDVEEYFEDLNFFVPDRVSPSDYFLDVLEGMESPENRPEFDVRQMAEIWRDRCHYLHSSSSSPSPIPNDDTDNTTPDQHQNQHQNQYQNQHRNQHPHPQPSYSHNPCLGNFQEPNVAVPPEPAQDVWEVPSSHFKPSEIFAEWKWVESEERIMEDEEKDVFSHRDMGVYQTSAINRHDANNAEKWRFAAVQKRNNSWTEGAKSDPPAGFELNRRMEINFRSPLQRALSDPVPPSSGEQRFDEIMFDNHNLLPYSAHSVSSSCGIPNSAASSGLSGMIVSSLGSAGRERAKKKVKEVYGWLYGGFKRKWEDCMFGSKDFSERDPAALVDQVFAISKRIFLQKFREFLTHHVQTYILFAITASLLSLLSSIKNDVMDGGNDKEHNLLNIKTYIYSSTAFALLCMLFSLHTFLSDLIQFDRESFFGLSPFIHFFIKDVFELPNVFIRPFIFLLSFSSFQNNGIFVSSFSANYGVLWGLSFSSTGFSYLFSLLFSSRLSPVVSALFCLICAASAALKKPSSSQKFAKILHQCSFLKWGIHAAVIANTKRFSGVWLLSRCGLAFDLGLKESDYALCLGVLIVLGLVTRLCAYLVLFSRHKNGSQLHF